MTQSSIINKNIYTAIWRLLPRTAQVNAAIYIVLSSLAMVLEVVSLGMVIPLLAAVSIGANQAPSNFFLLKYLPLSNFNDISIIVILLTGIFILKNIYLGFLARFQGKYVFELESKISYQLFKEYLYQDYSELVKKNSSELIRSIVGDVSNYVHNAVAPLFSLVAECFIVIGILSLLIYVDIQAALSMAFLIGGIGYFFHKIIRSRVSKWGESRQYHEGKRIQKIQEGIGAIKEIKIGSLENPFSAIYSEHMSASASSGRNQQALQSTSRLLLEVLAIFSLALLILVFNQNQKGVDLVSILGLYAAAAFRIMPSVNRMIGALQAIRFSRASVVLLTKEFNNFRRIKNLPLEKVSFENKIELSDVSFRHSTSAHMIFDKVNLSIARGDFICVEGPSGVGKSTLIDIICGLLKPTSGVVKVDDKSIEGQEKGWQKNISYVPQSIFLLDETILKNITFGSNDQNFDLIRLNRVVDICGLRPLLDIMPDGLNAMVGERGARISGGQRQRIGLARALYRKSRLLILDEATSALDADSEKVVLTNICCFSDDLTIICISHNNAPRTFANKLIQLTGEMVLFKNIDNVT